MSSDSSEFLNMYVEVLYEPRDYVCRHLKKQMDWSQGDTVPFVRSPGPPCVMVPTGSPCKSSGNSGLSTVSSLSPQLSHGALSPGWSTLTFSRQLPGFCYSVPYSPNLLSFLCVFMVGVSIFFGADY